MCLRWATLKAALVERRSKLGESKTIQQFSRDAEDIEAWVSEKLQTVLDESYKDPTNLQVFFLSSTNEPVNRLLFLLQHEWPSFRIWAGERGGRAKGLFKYGNECHTDPSQTSRAERSRDSNLAGQPLASQRSLAEYKLYRLSSQLSALV